MRSKLVCECVDSFHYCIYGYDSTRFCATLNWFSTSISPMTVADLAAATKASCQWFRSALCVQITFQVYQRPGHEMEVICRFYFPFTLMSQCPLKSRPNEVSAFLKMVAGCNIRDTILKRKHNASTGSITSVSVD